MLTKLTHSNSLDLFVQCIYETLRGQNYPNVLTTVDQAYRWILQYEIFLPSKSSRRLSDVMLSAQLQISRTPVRQALDRLAHEGLIKFDARRGYRTYIFTAKDINEICQLIEVNEVFALQLAIPNLKKESLYDMLEALYSFQLRFSEHDRFQFLTIDFCIHNLIINSSSNSHLIRLLAVLRSQLALCQLREACFRECKATALEEIELFLKALTTESNEQAANLLSTILNTSKIELLSLNKLEETEIMH